MHTGWAERQERKSYKTVKCGTHDRETKQAKQTYGRQREKKVINRDTNVREEERQI
jgi:hypothetical protein